MKKILVVIIAAMMLPFGVMAMNFSDLKESHWAYQEIQRLNHLGVIAGYPDKTIKPEDYITRAEFLKMISLICDKKEEVSEISFLDRFSLNSHWAYNYIKICAKKALLRADDIPEDINLAEINRPVTRAEIALILSRTFDGISVESTLSDIKQISPKHKEAITKVFAKEIIKGYPDGNFKPYENATRAEAFAMMGRTINLLKFDEKKIKEQSRQTEKKKIEEQVQIQRQEELERERKIEEENKRLQKDLSYLNEGESWYKGGAPKSGNVKVEDGKKWVYIADYGWMQWYLAGTEQIEGKGIHTEAGDIIIGH